MLLIYLLIAYSGMVTDAVSPDCQPGRYLSYQSNTCQECLAGTYQSQAGQTYCPQCSHGSYQPRTGSTSCIDCDTGTYQNQWGSTQCLKCQPGQYQDATGQTSCKYCTLGSYSLSGATSCTPCEIGTYRSSYEQSCSPCESGKTTSESGSDSYLDCITACPAGSYYPHKQYVYWLTCHTCPAGSYSKSGVTSCTLCEVGTYQDRTGQSTCSPCGDGKTTNGHGADSYDDCIPDCQPGTYLSIPSNTCSQCLPGTYQNQSGQTDCRQCSYGTYQPRTGATLCVVCPAGTYQGQWGSTQCLKCQPGQYQDATGQTSCKYCTLGSYSLSGATSCTPCEIGTYRSSYEQSCIPCESGKTTSKSGSESNFDCIPECQSGTFRSGESGACLKCSEGTYQPRSGQINCVPCNLGTHQNLTGQTTCYACSPGTYQPSTGASACLPCPTGRYSKSGASLCTPCENGSYQDSPMQSSCIQCEAGKTTNGPGADSYTDCIAEDTASTGVNFEVSSTNIGVIAGGTGGAIAVLLVVVFVIFIAVRQYRLKEARNNKTSRQDNVLSSPNNRHLKICIDQQKGEVVYTNIVKCDEESKEETKVVASVEYESNDNAYYNIEERAILPHGAVMLSDLWDYVQEKTLDGSKLSEEFQALPSGLLSPIKAALKAGNSQKNRYKGLYPYDSTSVKLFPLGEDKSDYINASFIDGYSRPKAYIASQGTTKFNINDFWRMIFQQDVEKIVMLTRLAEGNTMKCLQYWPNEGSQQQYGGVKVTLVHVDAFAEYDIRILTMTVENTTKQVTQFHFTAWPDKGVPEAASSIVQFWHKVRNAQPHKQSPTVVHCSAGIGRTGTYIALDYLVDQGIDKQYVHIFPCVAQLRGQRVNLVQTEDQYRFLHEALVEALMVSGSAVSAEKFPSVYSELLEIDRKQGKTGLLLEFEKLQNESNKAIYRPTGDYDTDDEEEESESKKETITNNPQRTSKLEMNKHKNRYSNIIPADEYTPCLSLVEGRTDYINTVKLPSHRQKDGLIITQMPTEDTVIDFWRLVYDFGVRTIVMLNVLPRNKDGIGVYWPSKGESMTEMVFKIENVDESTDNTVYVWRTIRLTKDGEQPREVRQFQCKFWPESDKVPLQADAMLKLIDGVEQWQRQSDIKTVVIHCMDGAERSGLYCVLTTVLERLNVERDVAIYQTVKKMRTRRQQIIPNFEQYKYCHEVVLDYLSNFGMYSNFSEI